MAQLTYNGNVANISIIPSAGSVSSREMFDRQENGLSRFRQIRENNPSMLLKEKSWSIITDFILQNMVSNNKIEFLQTIKQLTLDSLIPQPQFRRFALTQQPFCKYMAITGCLEFFQAIGFMAIDGEIIMMEADEGIIIVASTSISNKIEILKMYKSLSKLWLKCMSLMKHEKEYNKQDIFYQLNFDTNYYDYYFILTKLLDLPITHIKSRRALAIKTLQSIGFKSINVSVAVAQNDKNKKIILDYIGQIYDMFNKIERFKQKVWLNTYSSTPSNSAQVYEHKYDDDIDEDREDEKMGQLPAELPESDYQSAELPQLPVEIEYSEYDYTQNACAGSEDFIKVLSTKPPQQMYFKLLDGAHWDILIDAIYWCVDANDPEYRLKRLKTLRVTVKKAGRQANEIEDKYKTIDLNNDMTHDRLMAIPGAMLIMQAIGFEDVSNTTSRQLQLKYRHTNIIEIALRCLDYKIELLAKLAILQKLWRGTIALMYTDPLFTAPVNIMQLDALCAIDLLCNRGSYNKLSVRMRNVVGFDDKLVPIKVLEALGLTLALNHMWNQSITIQILTRINSLYARFGWIERFKKGQLEVNKMALSTRTLESMYNELNRLWWNCVASMQKQQMFHQQFIILNKLKSLDFMIAADYEYMLRRLMKIGAMKIYSTDILAARQILIGIGFDLPQLFYGNATEIIILQRMVQIYEKFDDIERQKSKQYKQLIRVSEEHKYDAEFKNNDDNVIGDFSPRLVANYSVAPESFPELQLNQQRIRGRGLAVHAQECRGKTSLTKCEYSKRVMHSLEIYESMNKKHWKLTKQIKLVQYFMQKHQTLLDDHIHVITHHNKELGLMHKFAACSIKDCLSLQRYHSDRDYKEHRSGIETKGNDVEDIAEFTFFQDIMDSVHCYTYHLHDIGLAVANNRKNDQDMLKKAVSVKKAKHVQHKNKFNINNTAYYSATFIGGMLDYMIEENIARHTIQTMYDFLYFEEYDTDALFEDIEDDAVVCNVALFVQQNRRQMVDCVVYCRKCVKVRDTSFSIGYRFYYWEYYKHKLDTEKEYFQNKNCHSGYQVHELYIPLKYKDMKHEIFNNKICNLNIDQFKASWKKSTNYMSSKSIKKIRAEENAFLRYGIRHGSYLSVCHLFAVTLYCDWSDLSTAFSATFRKAKAFESIVVTKTRNREFANWSKTLRETVELYGNRGWEQRETDEEIWNAENNRIRGPFFCGMSVVLVMPEFNIRICAPTSTSSRIEVANNFATDDGIIIVLNNDGHWHSSHLRIWDCSWLSSYAVEDEKLLMGGFVTTRIQGITIKASMQNFQVFFEPLFYFDCMLTGISMMKQKARITDKHKRTLNHVILCHLEKTVCGSPWHEYIHDTFSAYTNHRKQIVINLHQMHTYFTRLKDFIIQSGGGSWECSLCYSQGNNVNSWRCWACKTPPPKDENVYGYNNVLKADIFNLFQQIHHIVIYTTSGSGQHEYVFDLTKLLRSIIDGVSVSATCKRKGISIEIKATHRYRSDNNKEHIGVSWLAKEWERSKFTLQSFLHSINWNINLSETKNHGACVYLEDTLTITTKKYN